MDVKGKLNICWEILGLPGASVKLGKVKLTSNAPRVSIRISLELWPLLP